MIKLNDSFGLDLRIENINKQMSDEQRRLVIISKALTMADAKILKRIEALTFRSAEYKANVNRLSNKL